MWVVYIWDVTEYEYIIENKQMVCFKQIQIYIYSACSSLVTAWSESWWFKLSHKFDSISGNRTSNILSQYPR